MGGPIRSGWIWILKHLKYKLHLKHILANVSTCVFSAKLFSHIKWSKEMRLSTSCARRNTRNAVLLKKKWKLQAFQLTSQIDWSCDVDQRLHWNQPVLAASALLGWTERGLNFDFIRLEFAEQGHKHHWTNITD